MSYFGGLLPLLSVPTRHVDRDSCCVSAKNTTADCIPVGQMGQFVPLAVGIEKLVCARSCGCAELEVGAAAEASAIAEVVRIAVHAVRVAIANGNAMLLCILNCDSANSHNHVP